MSVPPHIEIEEVAIRLAGTGRRDRPGPLVPAQNVEHFEVQELEAVQGDPGIGDSLHDSGAGARTHYQFHDGGCIQDGDHAASAPLPDFAEDLARRWIRFDRGEPGNAGEQFFPGGLLQGLADLAEHVIRHRCAGECRTGLEPPVQLVRYISYLKHL